MLELLQRLDHPWFTYNGDPSHWEHQGIDCAELIRAMPDGVFHVNHIKGARRRMGGKRSILSHLPMGHHGRGWNYIRVQDADTYWPGCIEAFNDNGLPDDSELSLEHEHNGSNPRTGAKDAHDFMRGNLDFLAPSESYEAQMAGEPA
jgi:sugar phosphate isomerase/epimerase